MIELARRRACGAGDNVSLAIVKLVEALPSAKPVAPPGFVPRQPAD